MTTNNLPVNIVNNEPKTPKKPFRILSLDGGGVRAIIQAIIVNRLSIEVPQFIDQIDMFAGTSAGSIVALALADGMTTDQTKKMWEEEVTKIFVEGYWKRVSSLNNAIGAAYTNDELKKMLEVNLKGKKLSDIKKKILIPTFNLDKKPSSQHKDKEKGKDDNDPATGMAGWAPEFFHNFPKSENADTQCVDVCLMTTAAPTYFPIYQGRIDGGTYANCPAMVAVTSAINAGVKPEDIVVLSLSTGNSPQHIPSDVYGEGNWGIYEWGTRLIDILLDANTQSTNYQCECLLSKRYHRIDPLLKTSVGLDQSDAVSSLEEVANQMNLDATVEWLKTHWVRPEGSPIYKFEEDGIVDDAVLINKEEKVDPPQVPSSAGNWGCIVQ
eukprot:TRINITY_DN4812_c0_g1_i1.p1 TRINITY_DN4812_c0_g1~~TRINITY_DN4812_c0_g1_i1.p1  ORF type:complete len:382 (-),score=167.25 TRINITY_DN4812_c0_g1_i1:232-1377(-)